MEKFPRARAAAETFLKDEDLQMSLALDGVLTEPWKFSVISVRLGVKIKSMRGVSRIQSNLKALEIYICLFRYFFK